MGSRSYEKLLEVIFDKQRTANIGLVKGGLTFFVETLVLNQTFVLRMKVCASKPPLLKTPKCK